MTTPVWRSLRRFAAAGASSRAQAERWPRASLLESAACVCATLQRASADLLEYALAHSVGSGGAALDVAPRSGADDVSFTSARQHVGDSEGAEFGREMPA